MNGLLDMIKAQSEAVTRAYISGHDAGYAAGHKEGYNKAMKEAQELVRATFTPAAKQEESHG